MKTGRPYGLALAGLAAALLAPLAGCAEPELERAAPPAAGTEAAGRGDRSDLVTAVADGDTISLAGLGRVRLLGRLSRHSVG